jgi:aminopeptidase
MTHIRLPGSLVAVVLLLPLAACNNPKKDMAGTETAAAGAVTPAADSSSGVLASVANFKSVAHRVVAQSAGVGEGDIVMLTGDVADLPLLEDIAIEVSKAGGYPLVSVGTEALSRRMYDEVPAKYDSQEPRLGMKLAEMVDVFISTESGEGRTLRGVPPERMVARGKTFQPVMAAMQKRGVRSVSLGNGLYPTAERAEQFGMSRTDLAKIMYGGIDADYSQLQTTGEELRKTLAAGNELHITSPAGTDLKVKIKGRQVLVSDGIISADDRKRGGAATSVWLPAGEVYVTPVAGTAEGVVVADHIFYQGQRVDGLKLEIKGGKLASMTAKSGLEPLKSFYDAAGEGKDIFGVVDIGINPGINVPEGAPVNVWARAGAVTVGVGNNTWAGGDIRTPFAVNPEVPKATLTVDGKELVRDGKLVGTATMALQP